MDKCRLCLKNSKKLRSVFDKEDDVVYIDMITSISNIQIRRNDKFTHLCLQCRRKLREAFHFKNMIEMSNLILCEDSSIKRINFNTLEEIQTKAKIDKNIVLCENNYITEVLENCFKDDTEFFWFNNTIIKRVESKNCTDEMNIYDVKPEPNDDDLDGVKPEPNDDDLDVVKPEPNDDDLDPDYDYGSCGGSDTDDEYIPKYLNKKNKEDKKGKENRSTKKMHKESKNNKNTNGSVKVLIKPVLLRDIGILRTQMPSKPRNRTINTKRLKKQMMCNFCGKMTSSMKSHILVHTGKRTHKCDICEKAYYTESLLKSHKKKHEFEKHYKCDQCIAKFSQPSALKSHMIVHNGEKSFVCHICNKSFKRKNALRRHVMSHNSANKTVKCELCNMTFFSKYGLRHHLRVHTGERPYRCEMCSQGYSYKHDFNRHCFKKHGVFLKRRKVHVMNEEVLVKERELMRLLMLRLQGVTQGEDPFKEFEGPQGYKALAQAINLIESKQLPVDVHF